MATVNFPERTRRYLELEYSYNPDPEFKTISALAQITGSAIEDVIEWFRLERQRHLQPPSLLDVRGSSDQESRNEPGTILSREVPAFHTTIDSQLTKKMPRVNGQQEGEIALSRNVDFDNDVLLKRPLPNTTDGDIEEMECASTEYLSAAHEHLPRLLEYRSRSASTSDIVGGTPKPVVPNENGKSGPAAKTSHSLEGLSGDDIPGVVVFPISDTKETILRKRRRYTEEERRQVAETRKRGACADCKASRMKCVHDLSSDGAGGKMIAKDIHEVFALGLTSSKSTSTGGLLAEGGTEMESYIKDVDTAVEVQSSKSTGEHKHASARSKIQTHNGRSATGSIDEGRTPIVCTLCGFRPTGEIRWHKRTLERHMAGRHFQTKKVFSCTHIGCKSSFTRADNLSQHLRLKHSMRNSLDKS